VRPNYTWITMLLPGMDQAPLYNMINFSAQGFDQVVGGKPLQSHLLSFLQCPSDVQYGGVATTHGVGWTCYAAAAGWHEDIRHDRHAGVFTLMHNTKFRDITDGSSNTIMVSEVGSHNFYGGGRMGQGSGRRMRQGAEGVMRSALVAPATWGDRNLRSWDANNNASQENIWLVGYTGPYVMDPIYVDHYTLNSDWPGASSSHTGGIHSLFADGSVRFISENILHHPTSSDGKLSVWISLHSMQGGSYNVNGGY